MALRWRRKKQEEPEVQFTDKIRPKKGIFSICLAVLCFGLMLAMIVLSAMEGGEGGWYLGAGGMAALFLSVIGFILAVRCFRMENIYYGLPLGGAFLNGVLLLGCLVFYVLGVG
ncbi:MAG: DUF6142 family protein [Lachnospiraceae bacterium]|nr:DUF6142 family protein [Lachnospiraceae bacterium]